MCRQSIYKRRQKTLRKAYRLNFIFPHFIKTLHFPVLLLVQFLCNFATLKNLRALVPQNLSTLKNEPRNQNPRTQSTLE
jgi:hypothetical protein